MKRKLVASALAIGLVAGLAGSAVAGHLAEGVKSYTGCLVSKDGVIIKVKEGESPSSPCSGGMVQVHFGGGDITSISVTGALTGGGDNGAITIGLKPEFTLPAGCDNGEIAEWNGSAWVCGTDSDTTYSAGTGLDLSAGNAFSIEPGYRLPASATTGDSVIKASDGTWAPQRYAKANQTCTSGQFVEGVTSTGGLDCGAPAAGGLPHGWSATGGAINFGGTIDVLTLDLPAGAYFLTADVEIINRDGDTASAITCTLGSTTIDFDVVAGNESETYGSLSGVSNHPGGPLSLRCFEHSADADIARSNLQAVQLSGIN